MTDKDLTISKPVVTSTRFFMLKLITDPARRAAPGPGRLNVAAGCLVS